MKKSFFAALAIAATTIFSANAQAEAVTEYAEAPYWFFGVKGGVQATPTNYDFTQLITPAFGVQLGRQFTPQVGLRLDVDGMWAKTAFRSADCTDQFSYVTGDLDLLLNLTNMFCAQPQRFGVSLVLGAGLNYSWDTYEAAGAPMADRGLVAHRNLLSHNLRGGLLCDYKINRHWAANLEVDANNVAQEFNSKWNGSNDWQLTAMVGLAYRWGHKGTTRIIDRTEPEPVVEQKCVTCGKVLSQCEYNGRHPEPMPAVVYTAPEEVHIEVFFDLDKSNIRPSEDAKLRGLSNFIRDHEVGTVLVKAYADRETGNPTYNQGLSERRAETIVNELIKTYGIPASRIESQAFGDKVQPFTQNDLNRVVIIDIKEAEKK